MSNVTISTACSFRLDEIYRYGRQQWGETQAKAYINGIFQQFAKLSA